MQTFESCRDQHSTAPERSWHFRTRGLCSDGEVNLLTVNEIAVGNEIPRYTKVQIICQNFEARIVVDARRIRWQNSEALSLLVPNLRRRQN